MPSPSHRIVRRLVPRFVAAFLAIGLLRWTGQWLGLYSNTVGVAIATTSGIIVSVLLVLWAGRSLDRTDQLLHEAEERFRGAFDSAAIGMALVSAAGRFVEVNRSLCELVGYPEGELLALTFQDITHPADLDADLTLLQRTVAGELPGYRMEKRYFRKDGRIVWVLLNVSLVRGEHGEPLHFVSQIEDITERREASERVAEAERRYRTLVEQLPLVTYVRPLDPTRATTYVSPQVEAMLGTTVEEWQRDPGLPANLVHPDDADRVLAAAHALRETGEPFREEYRYVARDGRVVWVQDETCLVAGRPGSRDGAVQGFLLDITERKHAEAERARLESELRHAQKLEAIGRLAGGVAHDFNNILTAVTGYSELLLERLEPGTEPYAHAREVRRSAAQAGSLTKQLLAFGRKQLLQPSAIDPNDVVVSAEGLLRQLVGERHTLRVDCAGGLGTVLADAGQVEHVLVNLVLNARDAMPAGGQIRVETRTADVPADEVEGLAAGRYAVVAVHDTGVGMDDETRARLFEPFFTTKPAGEGSGLGLSTAYGIATQSGGTIAVDSAPGRGSTVSLYLPLAPALRAVDRPDPPAAVPAPHATVLVAEDQQPVRSLVATVLEREGLRVLAAASGEEALQLAAGHDGPIDLLVTDVVMPGLDGDRLADCILATRPGTPVLYMSGYTEREALRRGAVDGEVAFLEKPFRPRELVEKVAGMLAEQPGGLAHAV